MKALVLTVRYQVCSSRAGTGQQNRFRMATATRSTIWTTGDHNDQRVVKATVGVFASNSQQTLVRQMFRVGHLRTVLAADIVRQGLHEHACGLSNHRPGTA